MTRDEISSFFPHTIFFGANTYAVPMLSWLQGDCYTAFKGRLWSENNDKWKVRFECRDFARAFASFALECWSTTTEPSESDGVAVGEIWFIPDNTKPRQGHAICPCFTDQGMIFIEPQTGEIYPMSPGQIASAYFIRF